MIVFNDKEMESEYCLSDDMVIVINSPLSLGEIFSMLQKGEEIDPAKVFIQAYINGNGKVRLANDHMPDKAPNGVGGTLSTDRLQDLEEIMVQQEGFGQRNGLFRALESYRWGNTIEGYEIKPINFPLEKPEFQELLRRHIALSSGVMPTLYKNREKSLKELVTLSNLGNDLFRNFGPNSIAKDNDLPTEEEIEDYQRFTEYEKQLVKRNNIHPKRLLAFKKALETAACKGAVITEDMYEKMILRSAVSDASIISERLSDKVLEYVDKVKAEFKKQYGFDRSPIIPEYITSLLLVNGDQALSDADIEQAVKNFNRNAMQAVVYAYTEAGKDKESKVTVAQSRNPALIWLGSQIPLQDMPQQLLRALATYVTPRNLKDLHEKGFVDWIKQHKNDSIADIVRILGIADKVDRFEPDKNAFELYQKATNKRADQDREKYERKYHYKFSDNETAIRGRNIVVEQGPYKIYMLMPDDLRNFSVAYTENTHCCQHFGNAGEACVWKYTTDPFAACVVVEDKSGQIQAQGFVWTDEAQDLFVFDNIEYHHDPSAGKLTNIIEAYIEALPYSNVQIGMGYVEAKDQAWNGIGTPITDKDPQGKMPTTLEQRGVYSDYHTSGGSKARVMKKMDGRTHQAHLVKYTVNTNGLRITDPGDEPTRWDMLASKEFSFMLNDCSKSIEERLQMAEEFRSNPDKLMQMRVLESCPEAILTLEHPDPDVQVELYRKHKDIARRIQNPCLELQRLFVAEDPSYLKTIANPDPTLINDSLAQNGLLIETMEHPTPEQALIAVRQNGYAYRFLPPELLTEEVKMAAVMQAPRIASLLEDPSPEIQMEACRLDPDVMSLLEKPTISAQMAAVCRKPDLVLTMKDPAAQVVRVAVEHSPAMIRKFQFQYPELRMAAIMQNGFVIRELKDVTMAEYQAAVTQNPAVARLIAPPTAVAENGRVVDTMEDYDGDGIDL